MGERQLFNKSMGKRAVLIYDGVDDGGHVGATFHRDLLRRPAGRVFEIACEHRDAFSCTSGSRHTLWMQRSGQSARSKR
jgi:hypothetical protein